MYMLELMCIAASYKNFGCQPTLLYILLYHFIIFAYIWSFLFLQFYRQIVGCIKLAPWLSSAAGAIRWPRLRRHNQGQRLQLTCAKEVARREVCHGIMLKCTIKGGTLFHMESFNLYSRLWKSWLMEIDDIFFVESATGGFCGKTWDIVGLSSPPWIHNATNES